MSELIAAKVKGDLLERYNQESPPDDGEKTESEYVRELLDVGLRAREEPLYVRLGLPNRHAARLEDLREAGEREEDVVRRVLREAVEGWEDDVLDELEADDDLRERVEAAREEGETLDDAVRRLLRVGAKSVGDENSTSRRTAAGVILLIGGGPAALAALGAPEAAFSGVAAMFLWVLFGGVISTAIENTRSRLGV